MTKEKINTPNISKDRKTKLPTKSSLNHGPRYRGKTMDVRQCASTRLAALFMMLMFAASSGCARLNSIHRGESVPSNKGRILSIDSKQRNVISAPATENKVTTTDSQKNISTETTVTTYLRFCSEPPPDVFTAIASTLGLKAATGTDKARQDISAELQQTISENAATIERTQTVNILRESMFRTCERYLSGAISGNEFIVQAARDQRAMVHVLAIEQLTGASRAQATALTTLAKAASSGITDESMQILDKARSNALKAVTAADTAANEAKSQAPTGDCQTGDKAYADSGASDADIAAKKSKCAAATKASADAKDAADYYATVKTAIEKQTSLSAQTSGQASAVASSAEAATKTIADAVLDIVKKNNEFSEIEMTCVVFLRNSVDRRREEDSAMTKYEDACIKLAEALTETRIDEIQGASQEKIRARSIEIRDNSKTVWGYINKPGSTRQTRIAALGAAAGIIIHKTDADDMANAANLEEFTDIFRDLVRAEQFKLAEAAKKAD